MPIQILLTGIVLTLVAVLFIHLLFTAPYHWFLAPLNYALQLAGTSTLLVSLIATLHVVLSRAREESGTWPYMLSYIGVNVPPGDDPGHTELSNGWNIGQRAAWMLMMGTTSGLIQVCFCSIFSWKPLITFLFLDDTHTLSYPFISFKDGKTSNLLASWFVFTTAFSLLVSLTISSSRTPRYCRRYYATSAYSPERFCHPLCWSH
jgi:hypothetical protein